MSLSDWYHDVYHVPEKFGLTLVGEIQWGEPDYSFNMTIALRRNGDGQLFYGDDSGCSCPSPFEDFTTVESLTPCTRGELQAHLYERNSEGLDPDAWTRWDESGTIADLMHRVADYRPAA